MTKIRYLLAYLALALSLPAAAQWGGVYSLRYASTPTDVGSLITAPCATSAAVLYNAATPCSSTLTFDPAGSLITSRPVSITDTVDSSSTTTGSLKTAGGLAVVKNIYGGSNIILPASNPVIELGAKASANTPAIDFNSSGNSNDYDARLLALNGTTVGSGELRVLAGTFTVNSGGEKFGVSPILTTSANPLSVTDTTDSSSTTTGSLKTAGGLGVAKDTFIGGELVVQGAGNSSFVGNVGIGTAGPVNKLSVIIDSSDGAASMNGASFRTSSGNGLNIGGNDTANGAWIQAASADPLMLQPNGGNVGIVTTAPDKALEINSATGANLRLTYNDADGSAANYADFSMSSGGNLTVAPSGGTTAVTGALSVSTDIKAGNGTVISSTAPTIASGGCTSPTVTNTNGTAHFTIDVGTSCSGSQPVVFTLPAATIGWNCYARNVTNGATSAPAQTGAVSTTAVTITNFVRTTGVAGAWTDGDDVVVSCLGG